MTDNVVMKIRKAILGRFDIFKKNSDGANISKFGVYRILVHIICMWSCMNVEESRK